MSNEPCYKWKRNILGSSLTLECSFFIYNTANAAEAKQLASGLPAWLIAHKHAPPCLQASGMAHCSQTCTILHPGFRHGSLLTNMHHLAFRLPAWLIAHKHAPPCLQASGMAHCSQTCTTLPSGFRHGSLLTNMHHLAFRLPAWLIAHKHAPPCLQASNMAHCSQTCTALSLLL